MKLKQSTRTQCGHHLIQRKAANGPLLGKDIGDKKCAQMDVQIMNPEIARKARIKVKGCTIYIEIDDQVCKVCRSACDGEDETSAGETN